MVAKVHCVINAIVLNSSIVSLAFLLTHVLVLIIRDFDLIWQFVRESYLDLIVDWLCNHIVEKVILSSLLNLLLVIR